jgi:hypothetical protein
MRCNQPRISTHTRSFFIVRLYFARYSAEPPPPYHSNPGADSIDCHLPVVAGTDILRWCSSREIPVPREQVPRKKRAKMVATRPRCRHWKWSCHVVLEHRRILANTPVLRITGGVYDDSGVPVVPEKLMRDDRVVVTWTRFRRTVVYA